MSILLTKARLLFSIIARHVPDFMRMSRLFETVWSKSLIRRSTSPRSAPQEGVVNQATLR
jgi:hypothetical protein